MDYEMTRRFASVVEFLGSVLGPDYEITLYDLETELHAVVAIANGRISGQTLGSPLPVAAEALLRAEPSDRGDSILNFTSHLQSSGKAVRSSALVLRDDTGKAVGLLGINFDDSRFLALSSGILALIHPDNFVRREYAAALRPEDAGAATGAARTDARETIHNDVSGMIREIFDGEARSLAAPTDRLTQEERVAFIAQLKRQGMFRLKGAVQYTAEQLCCSQASIYRYLSKIRDA